jgi:hypothetical protein
MVRTGMRIADTSIPAPRLARRLGAGLLLMVGALALGGCLVVPARQAYAPAPVYVAPAPVYVAPPPVYVAPGPAYYYGGYGWRRYGRW